MKLHTHLLSRTTRYILGALGVVFLGHIIFQYILYTSSEVEAKTGTFVEALTPGYEISYLPYTQTSEATRLYQSMFFDACLDYSLVDGRIQYTENLCSITTNDNKSFVVEIARNAERADSTQLTLDDVYATYQRILIENNRSIPSFGSYKDIAIERRANDLVVTFPEPSVDNRIFFTYFILPEVITNTTHADYVQLAKVTDIGSGCARIKQGTRDASSIVMDLTRCDETAFKYYQLKYISEADAEANFSYVDIIKGDTRVENNFINHEIPTRQFPFLFFNVESEKLSPKIQRALGGYIDHNFRNEDYANHLINNQLVFNNFLSTGNNVANYIAAKNPDLPVDKYDLEKLNVVSLPTEINVSRGDKLVYFLESIDGYKTMKISLDESYEKLTITHNDGGPFTPRTYNPSTKTFYYTVAPYNANLIEGLNEYTIKAVDESNEEITVAELDVYFLTSPLQEDVQVADENKIHIAYIYHPTLDYIVDRLKTIFQEADMEDYFLFDGYDDPDSFEGRLLSQDYDMVLRIVDLGQRNDLRSLFAGKNPILNPSLYSQGSFLTALGQYATNPDDQAVFNNIMTLYGKDMPFVIFGQMFETLAIHQDIDQQLPETSYDYVYDLYKNIYQTVILGTRISISWEDIFAAENMVEFLRTGGVKDKNPNQNQPKIGLEGTEDPMPESIESAE